MCSLNVVYAVRPLMWLIVAVAAIVVVCVGGVILQVLVYLRYERFVLQVLYVCVLCANPRCYILHELQFLNAGRGCKRRLYGRGILQSQSHDCLVGSHECRDWLVP